MAKKIKQNDMGMGGDKPSRFGGLFRRQSAPRPSAESEAERLSVRQGEQGSMSGAVNGFKALSSPIGREQIHTAVLTLQKYKQGKARLEQKIIENEEWYRLRHWECMRREREGKDEIEPASAWLFNSIANKHADAMDNFPMPNILPREEGDRAQAEMLTSIIPVVLEQSDFEEVYSDEQTYKLKTGTGVYGVFWDNTKHNGLGDISIKQIDLINLFWQPGIKDIQKSRHVFHVELVDNDALIESYPFLRGRLGTSSIDIAKYVHDDTIDTSEKSAVVDWYYKKNIGGKVVLHYCKFVGDAVLFATENEPDFSERGWYDHGMYPFVFDPLFSIDGTPAGFGYIDIAKSPQSFIDRGDQAILQNMFANSRPRHLIRDGGGINAEEYADLTCDFVHFEGDPTNDIYPIQGKPLNDAYIEVIRGKVDELKETTGNRDVSSGGTTSGVTAASAIAAMQEAGSKLSRDNNKASYRAFRKVCTMIIELMRQFYDVERSFRILGENGTQRFVSFSNAGISPQSQGSAFGQDLGYRLPLFDVEVTAQKQSPYTKMAQNELAMQFYSAGFFDPQRTDQALACLDMMDFDRKHFVMQKIEQNGTMYRQILMLQKQSLMLAEMLDRASGTSYAEAIAANITGQTQGATVSSGGVNISNTEALGGDPKKEADNTKTARQRVAESTSPR